MSTGEKASPIFPSAIRRAYDLLVAGVSPGSPVLTASSG